MSHEQVVDGEAKFRWYSVLTTGREIPNKTKQLNLKHTFFLGTRYESTAAESDSSSSPPSVGEKYEYQAEVHQWRFWGISFFFIFKERELNMVLLMSLSFLYLMAG